MDWSRHATPAHVILALYDRVFTDVDLVRIILEANAAATHGWQCPFGAPAAVSKVWWDAARLVQHRKDSYRGVRERPLSGSDGAERSARGPAFGALREVLGQCANCLEWGHQTEARGGGEKRRGSAGGLRERAGRQRGERRVASVHRYPIAE